MHSSGTLYRGHCLYQTRRPLSRLAHRFYKNASQLRSACSVCLALIFESIERLSSGRETQFINFLSLCLTIIATRIGLAEFDEGFFWAGSSFL